MSYEELRGIIEFRPLTEIVAGGADRSPFKSSMSATGTLLAREIGHLRPDRALLEAGFTEGQLRQDGLPKASSAEPYTSGVVLTLVGTPYGDLRYPCTRFWRWQDNLRAIALALEALRKVDRYGVTKRGEQYAGWKALPAGADDGPNAARGRDLIAEHGGVTAALMATHPDRGGTTEDFRDVQAARDTP